MARDETSRSRGNEAEVDLEKFRMDHGRPILGGDAQEVVFYAKGAEVFQGPETSACLAKSVKSLDLGTTRYFIKFSRIGRTAGHMVDPNEEDYLGRRGDGRYEVRTVTKAAFDNYILFLKTGNTARLLQAEREVSL